MAGKLLSIYIAPAAGDPIISVSSAELVAGMGIVGDRYFAGEGEFSPEVQDPDHEVTLFELEKLRAFNEGEQTEASPPQPLTGEDMRRNLLTEGVDLNALVDHEFCVGDVVLRGIRLCEPCGYLRGLTRDSVLAGFAHRGGLRAGIVRGGTIDLGCNIS